MSVRALTWSFNLPLADMAAKAVLHALADHADEDGKCWPSLRRISLFAGCSENTARRALQRIEAMGIVRRESRPGQSDMFVLNTGFDPSQIGTPPKLGPLPTEQLPLPTRQGTPPKLGPHPSQRGTRTPKEPPDNQEGTPNEHAARLPPDWRPSQACRDYAADKGLDPDSTGEAFGDYFINGRGKREKRTDAAWERRFRIWCNTDAERKGPARGVRSAATGGDAGAFARAAARMGRTEPVQ